MKDKARRGVESFFLKGKNAALAAAVEEVREVQRDEKKEEDAPWAAKQQTRKQQWQRKEEEERDDVDVDVDVDGGTLTVDDYFHQALFCAR